MCTRIQMIMNVLKRSIGVVALLAFGQVISYGQYSVRSYQDPIKAQAVMHDFNDPYAFVVEYEEAPHPSGDEAMEAFLRQRKLEAQRQTPLRPEVTYQPRNTVAPPEILASFSGNSIITGTPLDNHLAIGPQEQVVSTINTHMLVTNNTGFWLGSYKLDDFFDAVGGSVNRFFDPRVIYDTEQDRFIMVIMNGSECADSEIAFAFSQTNDPRGAWNLYAIDGCLNDDGTFADYPMIALTDTELFLTYNAVNADSSWQTGFFGTQIHQINKMDGYNGQTLNRKVWTDISFGGRLLRNICPVRNADETLPESVYFVSNRNFDITNDTVFLLHLTGHQDDPDATLDMSYRVMDHPYGVPPYAVQTKDSMDTNDARILDGFELNGMIQFVGNSMDFNSGRSAFYHGIVYTDEASLTGIGNVVAHPTDYLGYPGIAWAGSDPSQNDALIIVSHCSPVRHPGGSAIYYDGLGEYSDFVTAIEGTRSVNMLSGTIERWGDYAGIQRFYDQPGSIWAAFSYGRPGNVHETWIAKVARTEVMVATEDVSNNDVKMTAYPNPSDDYVQIEIENPEGKDLSVFLFDAQGKPIETLFDGPANYAGKTKMTFALHTLPAGQYQVQVLLDKQQVITRSIVKI